MRLGHTFSKNNDITPKGWKLVLGRQKTQTNKQNTSFYVCSTDLHALDKQIHSISVVLKSNGGAIRGKYLEWFLREMVTEKGWGTLALFMWFIWANCGFWWSDLDSWGPNDYFQPSSRSVTPRMCSAPPLSLTRPSAWRCKEWKSSSSFYTPMNTLL